MTDTRTFDGRDINLAARATRDVLNTLLAAADLAFDQWVALRTAALTGPAESSALRGALADDLRVDATTAGELLDGLDRAGLTGGDGGLVSLTSDGQALYQRVQDEIGRATAELYGDIAPPT